MYNTIYTVRYRKGLNIYKKSWAISAKNCPEESDSHPSFLATVMTNVQE